VTAITRQGSTNEIPEGVKSTVRVDYDDEASLVSALKGQQFLIITLAFMAPADTQSKLIRAAAKAGVPYIMPNWYSIDFGNKELLNAIRLGPIAQAVIDEIESLGVSTWFILVCSFWYEFSLAGGEVRYGFDFPNKSVTFFDDGNTKITTSTWEQCGRTMAALLSLPVLPNDENDKSVTLSRFFNDAVYISSFLVSQKDMFESVKRVTRTTDDDWKISYESSQKRYQNGIKELEKGGISKFAKLLYSRVMFPNGDGDCTSKLSNKLFGLPQEELDECTKIAVRMGENDEVPY
jgi:hypothetical protein